MGYNESILGRKTSGVFALRFLNSHGERALCMSMLNLKIPEVSTVAPSLFKDPLSTYA